MAEVKGGIVLWLNNAATPHRADGWWWGPDLFPAAEWAPFAGPFASAEAAVKDAIAYSNAPTKVYTHDDVATDNELEFPKGYIAITTIDTDGDRWVPEGEKPAGRLRVN